MTELQKQLFELRDEKYAQFHGKLIPGIKQESIIGVRVPVLRKFAKQFWNNNMQSGNDDAIIDFLNGAPHEYYEENMLHMMLINELKGFDDALYCIEEFLPYIDNWAVCDSVHPKVFEQRPDKIYEKIKEWIKSEKPYTVRYAIGLLMSNFLDEHFEEEQLQLVASVKSSEYYVNLMIAWYFATALAKQWKASVPYIEKGVMEKWTHNKTIQKAVESFRITDEQKKYLKGFRKQN